MEKDTLFASAFQIVNPKTQAIVRFGFAQQHHRTKKIPSTFIEGIFYQD